jgi:nucleotide-binding universal stress UspA family protein
MSKTIVLAVDVARHEPAEHVSAAVEMVKDIAQSGDKVVVLHVHEFAVGRFGRLQVDCADGQGEALVDRVVADLGNTGLSAEGVIREADFGHVAHAIFAAATAYQARLLVLGSSSRTDLPWVPFGSVANRLLHIAAIPALIVPMRGREAVTAAATEPIGGAAEAAPAVGR